MTSTPAAQIWLYSSCFYNGAVTFLSEASYMTLPPLICRSRRNGNIMPYVGSFQDLAKEISFAQKNYGGREEVNLESLARITACNDMKNSLTKA